MTTYKPADVVLVPFPFADLSTTKKRPALVMASIPVKTFPDLVIISMMTSQIEGPKIEGDLLIKDWKVAGLMNPSKVRLAKLVTVEEGVVHQKLGTLTSADWKTIHKEFLKIFS